MLVRHTRSQIAFLLRQKEAVLTLWVLMLLVLFNFWENCQMFQGKDLLELAHTTKMGLLSWNRASYAADLALLFQQIYPLLVVCPAGFALAKERGTQEHVLMITGMGSGVYYFSKLISAFVVTAVVLVAVVTVGGTFWASRRDCLWDGENTDGMWSLGWCAACC